MSARPITTRAATERRARKVFRRRRRRRVSLTLGVALLAALAAAVIIPRLPDVVRELALPLAHEDIIRQQAGAKELDPSLLAAVIYAESRFTDATSKAGARGLMQITPETARYIAHLSGGTAFEQGDLSTPQVTSPTARSTCATCCVATSTTRSSRWRRTTAARATSIAGWPRRARPSARSARSRSPSRRRGVRRPRARRPPELPRALQPRARPVAPAVTPAAAAG